MPATKVISIAFTANLHGQTAQQIAKAAQVRLRPGEIDNEWTDSVGRGQVDTVQVSISRTNTPQRWLLWAYTHADSYDREAMAQLRDDVLSALREHAEDYRVYPSELYHPDSPSLGDVS